MAGTRSLETDEDVIWRGAIVCVAMFSLLVVAPGCATLGRDFKRPTMAWVSESPRTKSEILAAYGPPEATGQFIRHDQPISSVHYIFVQSSVGSVAYRKTCWFYFVNDRLKGISYVSDFPGDSVDYDAASVAKIKKGTTTKADVASRFGTPTGSFEYPVTSEKDTVEGDSMFVYVYEKRDPTTYASVHKGLAVVFDTNGVVKEVAFDASEEAGYWAPASSSKNQRKY